MTDYEFVVFPFGGGAAHVGLESESGALCSAAVGQSIDEIPNDLDGIERYPNMCGSCLRSVRALID